MNKYIRLLTISVLSVVTVSLFAQGGEDFRIYYKLGKSDVDTSLMDNAKALNDAVDFFSKVNNSQDVKIKEVIILSSASMEGDVISNRILLEKRNATARQVISDLYNIPDSLITCINAGVAWEELRDSVEKSDIQYKEQILYILDTQPEEVWRDGTLVDSRNKHLMDLKGGRPYKEMQKIFFPFYRYSKIKVVYSGDLEKDQSQQYVSTEENPDYGDGMYMVGQDGVLQAKDTVVAEDTRAAEDTLAAGDIGQQKDSVAVAQQYPDAEKEVRDSSSATSKTPILAFKTNALYLLAGVANAGVEARLADRFSFDMPVVFSPYTIKNNYRVRALALQPEFRFWFKEFTDGHFVGINGNFAWFNVALSNNNRYQDPNRPLMGASISYGYAWKILPCLSLEFTVSAGYANIHYDVFYNVENGIQYNSGVKNYWGLTKAGINLVYIININQRGR